MPFEEKTQPYELLFRFDEVTGALKGCHYKTIATVLKDGVAIAATSSEPQDVSVAQGANGTDLKAILGVLATAQAVQIDEHAATIKTNEADLKAKDANCQTLLEEVGTLRSKVVELQAELDALSVAVPLVKGGDPVSTEVPASVTPDSMPVHPLLDVPAV